MFDLLSSRGIAKAHEDDASAELLGILARRGCQDLVIANARQRTRGSIRIQQPRPLARIERTQGADRLGRSSILDCQLRLRCNGAQPVGDGSVTMREFADQERCRLELTLRFELVA